MKCYIKDYPRPQFVRKEWESSIANCSKVNELEIKTIVFNSKSNIKEKTNLYRVDNWKDIYVKIKQSG